jgi:VCBS repeat-containing protein
MPFSGQLWYTTEGGDADTRIVRINDDGTGSTTVIDNGAAGVGDDKLPSSFTSDLAVDTAAGFYFAINSSSLDNNAILVRGAIGSSAAPVTVIDFPDNIIVNTMEIDTVNHKIYVGHQDGNVPPVGSQSGIRVYSYDPLTGAVTDNGFLTTAVTDNRANEGPYQVLDPQDFAIDYSIVAGGRMFYSERVDGLSVGLFRLDLNNPNVATALVADSQFNNTSYADGLIIDVEVDESTDLVYFTTHSQHPSPLATYDANDNALWYISGNATNGTAVKVTLTGLPGGNVFYPGDMTFDQSTRQIYIESEEVAQSGNDTDDVIYVFQLNGAGTSASLIRTISPGLSVNGANIEGMTFTDLAALSVSGTATATTEQGATTTLLSGAPTITDTDGGGYLASATVQITGGTFSSNENSTADDHLGYGAGKQIAGLISGTSISVSWNAATETLTLTGYDTFAHYQSVLAAITYWTTGDNPTNYGANTSRTLTWTINDGTLGVVAGSVNSGTTTINIAAVNDAPVNGTVSSATGAEASNIAVTGLQVSDVDANPASAVVTVTLSVTKGVLTLRTDVASGLVSGDIVGNGAASVTVTATINKINATLAASNGLVFLGNPSVSGTDTLTVVTTDGGATGSGGAQSDTDGYTITIIGTNDAPVVAGDGTETLAPTNEEVANAALTNTVSALIGGQYSDADTDAFAGVAVTANGSSAGTGQWQYYNGSTWVNIGAASTAAAVTIAASAPLRFLPATDYNGPAPALTVKLVDASGGALTSGAVVNTTTSGGSTPYSAATVALSHTVTAVNDAPTVTGGSAVSLTTIGEDSAPGAGQTISSLFTGHFSDAKDQVAGGSSANALAGVGVTGNAATAAQGVYQYFEGGTWHDLPAVSTASAFVLDASTLVRFVPAADYSGTAPALTVSLIEDSSGAVTTGATADLSTTGGTTPYSAALTLNVTVTATNDAPSVSGSATLAAVNEDTAAPGGQTVSTLFNAHFVDPDGDGLAGVAITGNAVSSQGVWQYFNGAWNTIGSPSEASALVLAVGTLVRFLPTANFNGAVPALTAYLIDNSGGAVTTGTFLDVSVNGGQTRFSDTSLSLTTSITAVNDTPVVPATATTVGATEQTAAVLLGSVAVSDVDLDARNGGNGDYGGASFTVQRALPNAADSFGFANSGLYTFNAGSLEVGGLVFGTVSIVGNVLTINFTSSGTTATTALVNDVIRHIAYINTSDVPPSSVTLNYALNDGAPGGGQGAGATGSAGGSVIVNITAVNDSHTGGASVTGTAAEDSVLTAVSTLVDPDGLGTLHYQWQRDVGGGYVNVGADQATYTLGDGDIGGVVRVVIYYTDAGGTVEAATSAATAAIVKTNDAPTGGVSITGTATEDQVLTADTSTLADSDGLGTLHYDWQRDTGSGFVSLGAADQATYTLGDADVGLHPIRVVVSYIDGQGFANSVTSAPVTPIANVNDLPVGGVAITGTPLDGQVLTADTSTLSDNDGLGALHYQWQRDSGSGFVNVGTDQSTYGLTATDVGAVIRVVTSYTDGQGTNEAVTSAATLAVADVNDAPTAANDVNALTQRLTVTGSVRANDGDVDNALATLTVTNVAYNVTHVNQAVVSGGTVVNGAHGKLTINPDGTYSYVADHEGLVVGEVATDKFDYTIKDPAGASATAQLTVTVTGSAEGDANANILISNGSAHTLTGRGGADTLTGGGGADVFAYEAIGDSTIAAFDTITDFVHGSDTLRLTPLITGSTKLTLTTDGTDRILSIDLDGNGVAEGQIKSLGQGLEVSDIATGVANFGFTIKGSAGADTLRGGAGGDILTGGAGSDTFVYGDGDSTILHWDVITDFQTGQDKLDIAAADDGVVILARFGASTFIYFGGLGNSSVVQVFGDIKTSDLKVSNGVTFTMYGDDGAGGGGGNALTGGGGDDVLVGGSSDSTLFGGDGADILYGGGAHDTFLYNSISNSNFSAYDSIINFSSGQDKIDISAIDGGKITIARFAGTTFIYSAPDSGGNFQSVITVSGTSLKASDVIGSGGATQAFVMVGDSTNHNVADTLVGGAGNDILYGLDGNDALTGGGGADFMLGGVGADTFVYAATSDSATFASDLIFDFSNAEGDKLDLTGIDANTGTGANDAFSVVSSFSSVAGQLVIAAPDSSGYYHVSGDVNGDGLADFVIALKVTGTLTSSDILL